MGARVAAGPGSPPKTLMLTELMKAFTVSDLVGVDFWWHSYYGYKFDYYNLIFIFQNIEFFLFSLIYICFLKKNVLKDNFQSESLKIIKASLLQLILMIQSNI